MKKLLILPLGLAAALSGTASGVIQDACGPFTDTPAQVCPFVLELYYLGITAGTSPTTYSPGTPLTRAQAAVLLSTAIDQSLARSSRRAALAQWWTTTPRYGFNLGVTGVGNAPLGVVSDGADLWVANSGDGTVSRVRASDGRLLETWTGAFYPNDLIAAFGRILVVAGLDAGKLYVIDPSQPPGAMLAVANLGFQPTSITFDGSRVWIANFGGIEHIPSISIVTPSATLPWTVTTVTNSESVIAGQLVFDGTNVWSATGNNQILRFDSGGNIVQTVAIDAQSPGRPAFDGKNLWVPSSSPDDVVTVVQAATGAVLATLTGNGLSVARNASFDGERVVVTNYQDSVSLWKAANLTALGSFATGPSTTPIGACSDGVNFWITLTGTNQLARF